MSSPVDQIDRYIARLKDRQQDWGVLKFQADLDPKYRRAQMRYVGGGGTGQHDDPNVIPASHFTLSTMVLPPGNEGPLHLHPDAEEVFFVLEGSLTCIWSDGQIRVERTLGPRDCIWVPAGVYRGLRNDGDGDTLFLVLLGAGKPELPSYPEDGPLAGVRRGKQEG